MEETRAEHCLEKLEDLIDLEHVARTSELQRRAFNFQPVDHIPTAIEYPVDEDEWPYYDFEQIQHDMDKMLLSELRQVYVGAKLQDDRLYGARANYGTGTVASMFGCEVRIFTDALPVALRLGPAAIDSILDAGVPDLRSGRMGRALDTVAYFRERLKPYPKLSEAVYSMMFDTQGPFDNASIVWGSEIFLAIYDEPEKVKRLTSLMMETARALTYEHRRIGGGDVHEHGGICKHLGGVCLRVDSGISLSAEHFEEFTRPYDSQLLEEFGGWIHWCGRAHQWWKGLLDIPGLRGVNPYQGEFYDLYSMYEACESAGVPIVQWTQPLDARCRERIRTGMFRLLFTASFDEALRARDRLHQTGHADAEGSQPLS